MPQRMVLLLPLFFVLFVVPLSTAGDITGTSLSSVLDNNTTNARSFVPQSTTQTIQLKPNKGIAHAFLEAHNHLRATFGERQLRWDKKLAHFARRWAFKMRSDCNLTHSNGPYGENIFIGLGKYTVAEAIDEWAKERWQYHWADNTCNPNEMCGHFTQMIWNETEAVGCARLRCNNASFVFVTCNYDPPGNYVGRRPILDYKKFVH